MKNIVEYAIIDEEIRLFEEGSLSDTIVNYLTTANLWDGNVTDVPEWIHESTHIYIPIIPSELDLLRESQELLGFELVEV